MGEDSQFGKIPFKGTTRTHALKRRRELESRFDEMIGRSLSLLWERTGRNYISSDSKIVHSDMSISHEPLRSPMLVRTTADRRKIPYAEFDREGFVRDEETTITVYNPDAEEILRQEAMRQGLLKTDLPEGVTLESLGYSAEMYDDGSPGRVYFQRAYPDTKWEEHQGKDREKMKLARERGSSNLEEL